MHTNRRRTVLVGVLTLLFLVSLGGFGYIHLQSGEPIGVALANILILSIPLALLYFCIGLIVEATWQHRAGGVGGRMAKFLFLTPRIAGILMALFVGLFALDAFEMPGSVWEKIGAFLVHAAPAIILLGVLALAWRWEWVGSVVFGLAAALLLVATVIPRALYGIGNLMLFVLPMAVVAVIFWLGWRWRGEIRGEN
jgi:hypothetical protein